MKTCTLHELFSLACIFRLYAVRGHGSLPIGCSVRERSRPRASGIRKRFLVAFGTARQNNEMKEGAFSFSLQINSITITRKPAVLETGSSAKMHLKQTSTLCSFVF